MKKTKPSFSLKDQLFNKEKVEYLSGLIKKVYPDFVSKKFEKEVLEKFPELELKQRISHIRDILKKNLFEDFEKSVNIMIQSLPKLEDNGTLDNNFGDFIFVPFCDYIQKFGCNKEKLKFSLEAQGKITAHASAEDSIRYFFNKFEDETFEKMLQWSKSDNYFLRRLASEGSRAKLPWCQKINLDYRKPIEILDNLYYDKSRFVTRSVANHLNDIAKIDEDLVVETLQRWKNEGGNTSLHSPQDTDLDYVISHGTRTLIKKGHKGTLEFLGYSVNPKITVNNFEIKNREVRIGKSVEFSFELIPLGPTPKGSGTEQKLMIDYKIYFIGKNGRLLSKVFKIKKMRVGQGGSSDRLHISKKHPLKIITTKALYSGEHFVEIMINGKIFGKKSFTLFL